jgi:hypothetical protein
MSAKKVADDESAQEIDNASLVRDRSFSCATKRKTLTINRNLPRD